MIQKEILQLITYMKKIFTLLCAAMMVAAVEAKVIMTESFEQNAGTLHAGLNTEMGSNTSDWWTFSGGTGSTPKFIEVVNGSLSYPGYATTGKGNKAHLWSTDADDLRQFSKEYTSGKVYLAAIINIDTLRQGTSPDYFLSFGDASASNHCARLYAKSVKESGQYIGFRLGVAKKDENSTYIRYTSDVLSAETNYLVVIEYEFVDGDNNDIVRLYVNPTKATTQPTFECVQDTVNSNGTSCGANTKKDAAKLASVNLRQGTNTPRNVFVDEITVATTWDELFADEGGDTPGGGDQDEDDALVIDSEDNLIANSSFEEYSCNAVFGCSFDDWSLPLNTASANSSDKLLGSTSIMINPTMVATIDQGVLLNDASYAAGTKFTLTLNYKIITMPEGGALKMDCYWEAAAGGDSEAIEAHDAEVLRGELASGNAWKHKVVTTTKPAKSAYLRVRVTIPKGAKVLFDAWCLLKETAAPDEPFIEVSPVQLSSVETTLGNSVNFQTVHIHQGNLTSKTTFYVGGNDKGHFQLSANELAADQSDLDLIITYAPTSAGTHTASLIFDNANHTTILPDMISLKGTCTDPSAKPVLTVTPSTLPDFEVLEGKQQKMTVTLSSVNCTDFVYARVDHVQGTAFTIDGTMFSKNSETTVPITFAPQTAGTYQSKITFYSQGAESVVLTVNGKGIAKTPETIDWQTDFVWDESNPLTYMDEPFDNIKHNETLLLSGWQNVAAAEARPWWGFDESKTTPARGTGKYAKATAYQFGKDSTALWDMWLVTPALDYKNAEKKVFAFNVMAEYLADEGNKPTLGIYYIDATGAELFVQDLTSSFELPSTSDENLVWYSYILDLTPYAQTMADVFHMAFRYTGPNGNEGVVTYYIDNVSWGKEDPVEGIESVQSSVVSSQKILRNGQLLILRDGKTYNVLGTRVE